MDNKSILIIRFSSLGDVVLTTSFIESVKKQYPDCFISVLTKDIYKDVFLNNPHIEKVFSIGDLSTRIVIKKLQKEHFDYIIDLHKNLRSIIVSWFIPSKIIRYKKYTWKRRIYVWFKKWFGKAESVRKRYIGSAGVPLNLEFSRLYCKREEIESIKDRFFPDLKYKIPIIGINTGARWRTKSWFIPKYIDLINKILGDGNYVILFGGESEIEFNKKIEQGIEKEKYNGFFINTTGLLNIRELFAAVSICNIMVTTDSALMHISQAFDLITIALFGSTVREFGFWDPRKNDILIEKNLSCRPCSLHGRESCPEKHFKCMNDITVSEVYESVIEQRKKNIEECK